MTGTQTNRLKIEYIPLPELIPYEGNPRIHSEAQIEKLKASIQEYGIVLPVLIDANNVIIARHAVVSACKELEIPELPCVRASNLTEAQTKAYILADNRLAEDSSWDTAMLKTEMLKLRDNYGLELEHTGFEKREILRLRMDIADTPKDEDATPEESQSVVSKLGDLWLLGDHRIICGSSTDTETVKRVLAGAKPHLMITDPPYGVNYDPAWRSQIHDSPALRTGKVLNDDEADWRKAWQLFPGDVAYVWHASLHSDEVSQSLQACNFAMRALIVWAKNNFALSRGDYHWQHECCWYALRKDTDSECPEMPGYCPGYDACWYAIRECKKSHWQGSRSESTLWKIDYKDQDAQTTHGTQKPVECMRRPMLNNSEPNDIIYEPFSGSGTTIIAAESCRRRCYAVELSPEYVDMAVRRWQEFTGQQAVLESDGRTFGEIAEFRSEALNDARSQGLYPKDTIANLLNISERRIEQLVKQKIIPKAGRGVFDLGPTVQAYVRYLQGLSSGALKTSEPSELDRRLMEARVLERESKARQAKYRADAMEQDIRERRLLTEIPQRLRECNYDTQLIDEVMAVVSEILGDSS